MVRKRGDKEGFSSHYFLNHMVELLLLESISLLSSSSHVFKFTLTTPARFNSFLTPPTTTTTNNDIHPEDGSCSVFQSQKTSKI
jgi:hypothetical protein